MRVNIEGTSRVLPTDEIRRVTHWYGKLLLTKAKNPKIKVNIKLCNLRRKNGNMGDAVFVGNTTNPTAFEVRLYRNLGRKMLLRVLAHEMAHVQQWAHGRMHDYPNGDIRWGKKRLNRRWMYRKKQWRLPWERDAINKEAVLLSLLQKYG